MTKESEKSKVFERVQAFKEKVDMLDKSPLSNNKNLVWLLQAQKEKLEIIQQNFELNYNRYGAVCQTFTDHCKNENYSSEPIAKDGLTLIDYMEMLLQTSVQFMNSISS